jgi:hypothetical protein
MYQALRSYQSAALQLALLNYTVDRPTHQLSYTERRGATRWLISHTETPSVFLEMGDHLFRQHQHAKLGSDRVPLSDLVFLIT